MKTDEELNHPLLSPLLMYFQEKNVAVSDESISQMLHGEDHAASALINAFFSSAGCEVPENKNAGGYIRKALRCRFSGSLRKAHLPISDDSARSRAKKTLSWLVQELKPFTKPLRYELVAFADRTGVTILQNTSREFTGEDSKLGNLIAAADCEEWVAGEFDEYQQILARLMNDAGLNELDAAFAWTSVSTAGMSQAFSPECSTTLRWPAQVILPCGR